MKTTTTTCLDLERMAAFLEGRLQGEDREQTLAHIDSCENCYELFTETDRVVADLGEEAAQDPLSLSTQPSRTSEASPSSQAAKSKLPGRLLYSGLAMAAGILLAFGLGIFSRGAPRSLAAFDEQYDRVTSMRAEIAQQVFASVAKVADRGLLAGFAVFDTNEKLMCLSLDDHAIGLSKKGLDLCYEDGAETADHRLAFLLGHELAHLAHGEYSRGFDEWSPKRRSKQSSDQASKASELRADRLGLLYMVLAGYDPEQLLKIDSSFFQKWAERSSVIRTDTTHPDPATRAEALLAEMRQLAAETEFFHFGVRLYDQGRFDDAIDIFNWCYSRFPTREVANNLGLCHYQKAVARLSKRCPEHVMKFIWPVALDRQILKQLPTFRGPPLPCTEDATFLREIGLAEDYFEDALTKDSEHISSKLNLMSALMVSSRAYIYADPITEPAPDRRMAQAKLLRQFLLNEEFGAAQSDVIESQRLLAQDPLVDPAAFYNLATMLSLTKQYEEAHLYWRRFLDLQPNSPYANYVRRHLGQEPIEDQAGDRPSTPFPQGPIAAATQAALDGMQRIEGGSNTDPTIYFNDDFKVLIKDNLILLAVDRSAASDQPQSP